MTKSIFEVIFYKFYCKFFLLKNCLDFLLCYFFGRNNNGKFYNKLYKKKLLGKKYYYGISFKFQYILIQDNFIYNYSISKLS